MRLRRTRGRRRQEDDSERPGLNLRLVIVLVLLAIIVPLFLKDVPGNSYGFGGSYFWLMALVMSFLAGVFYFSQFLLPLSWLESWYEAFRLTIRHNFPFIVTFTRWLFVRPKILGALPDAIKDLPPAFTKHKAGIIRSHQAPVIVRGVSFIRGAGPGFLRLKQGEIIVQVVDLRRHYRRLPVKALTRDGISIETGISTIFQVKRMENPPNDNWQFPFDQDAIFKVNYLGNFKMDDDTIMPWGDRVCRQAETALIGEVAHFSLDELFEPDESRAPPLENIKGRIRRDLRRAFENYGIEIIFVGVRPFRVPDDIKKQRIEIWQEDWQQKINVELGTAEAERSRRLKLARARAQIEIIEQLIDGLETVRQKGQDVKDILALRLIEAIEDAESDAAVRSLIPSQIVSDLKLIRNQVLGDKD